MNLVMLFIPQLSISCQTMQFFTNFDNFSWNNHQPCLFEVQYKMQNMKAASSLHLRSFCHPFPHSTHFCAKSYHAHIVLSTLFWKLRWNTQALNLLQLINYKRFQILRFPIHSNTPFFFDRWIIWSVQSTISFGIKYIHVPLVVVVSLKLIELN